MSTTEQSPRLRINDGRLRSFRDKGRSIAFICECDDPSCHRAVLLSAEEYEARRPAPILAEAHSPTTAARPE